MKKLHTLLLLLVITTASLYSSCKKSNLPAPKDLLSDESKISLPGDVIQSGGPSARTTTGVEYNTFYGPVVSMGEGRIRSWVNISHDNQALAIGIEMTDGALQLQKEVPQDDGPSMEFVLPLHQKAEVLTPFRHIVVNWNPNGHPPALIYTIPHFDFHFYKMSLDERLAIPSYQTDPSGFDVNPPAGYLPEGYIKSPGGEANMGAHWMDVTSPEFHGQPFTHTFVYGSYNGKVTFIEPMVTMATLQSGATIQKLIRQPKYVDPAGKYYPTRYNIWKDQDNDRHYIALDQMLLR